MHGALAELFDEIGGRYIRRGEITLSELDDLEYTWNAYHKEEDT